ncbi:uncharacterized protein [Clytia hemisphaerica]
MGRKCIVRGCKSNYNKSKASQNDNIRIRNEEKLADFRKIPMYGFPSKKKRLYERQRWIKSIPYLTEEIVNNNNTPAVCRKHWPENTTFETGQNGLPRPIEPPSIFDNIPSSSIPTPLPPPRPTKRTSFETRSQQEDEMEEFRNRDKLKFEDIANSDRLTLLGLPIVAFQVNGEQWIQSGEYISGIPSFSLKISKDLRFIAYKMGVQCTIKSLSKNRITHLDSWSCLEEALCFLKNSEFTRHQTILQEQIESMKPPQVGKKLYSPQVLMRAFGYFSQSRSLYSRLRSDFKLPSIKTLTNISSKVNNTSDRTFINEIVKAVKPDQRKCIVMADEVYVKQCLLYHGGTVFGQAENNPSSLATSVLGIMVKCLFGGPTFLFKMIPVKAMTAAFLFDQIQQTIALLRGAGADIKSIIVDGNRTNQNFFKQFDTVTDKPWLTTDGIFLLFDFVHLIKSIRNNWLTEKTGQLTFKEDDDTFVVKWSDLIRLHEVENMSNFCGVRGLSKLTEVAVRPKPVERQRVSTCLRVFCEETLAALKVHPQMQNMNVTGTVKFIEKVNTMWKILNVRTVGKDIRHNNPLEAVINSPQDSRLQQLIDYADWFLSIGKKSGGKRMKTLTKDTSNALHHTLNGLVELTKHLLMSPHQKYVMIGEFCSDPLEKEFGKLRQGSGGTYFITAQQVLEKLDIKKTKLLLKLNVDLSVLRAEPGHCCDKCFFALDRDGISLLNQLEEEEMSIPVETKMSLIYMAGYVARKDEMSEQELFDATMFYAQKYGKYLHELDRGGLKIPTDTICQWTMFSYIMFNHIRHLVCRTSLSDVLMSIAHTYAFDSITKNNAMILSNIFLNNFCKSQTPRSSKEASQKVLKLKEK